MRAQQTLSVNLYTTEVRDGMQADVLGALYSLQCVRMVVPSGIEYLDADGLTHYSWTVTVQGAMSRV